MQMSNASTQAESTAHATKPTDSCTLTNLLLSTTKPKANPRAMRGTFMFVLRYPLDFHRGIFNHTPLHVRNGLVGVVSLAVGKQVVNEHADYREKENDERPEDLVRDGAVRLEDLDCVCQLQFSTNITAPSEKKGAATS
jgi:hypothetical protein